MRSRNLFQHIHTAILELRVLECKHRKSELLNKRSHEKLYIGNRDRFEMLSRSLSIELESYGLIFVVVTPSSR